VLLTEPADPTEWPSPVVSGPLEKATKKQLLTELRHIMSFRGQDRQQKGKWSQGGGVSRSGLPACRAPLGAGRAEALWLSRIWTWGEPPRPKQSWGRPREGARITRRPNPPETGLRRTGNPVSCPYQRDQI